MNFDEAKTDEELKQNMEDFKIESVFEDESVAKKRKCRRSSVLNINFVEMQKYIDQDDIQKLDTGVDNDMTAKGNVSLPLSVNEVEKTTLDAPRQSINNEQNIGNNISILTPVTKKNDEQEQTSTFELEELPSDSKWMHYKYEEIPEMPYKNIIDNFEKGFNFELLLSKLKQSD